MAQSHVTIDPSVELLIREFEHDRLYGTIEIKYEAGRAVLLRKTESFKPLDCRNNRDEGGQSK